VEGENFQINSTNSKGRAHEVISCGFSHDCCSLWGTFCLAQEQRRYPVDPKTRWTVGATPPADELKKQLDSGSTVLIIDVRQPASFEKETIPGAINIPLAELEGHLKKMSKDNFVVFT
jgi:3-mercaptopyruvate sulfurtransferase SseA